MGPCSALVTGHFGSEMYRNNGMTMTRTRALQTPRWAGRNIHVIDSSNRWEINLLDGHVGPRSSILYDCSVLGQ